MNRQKAVQRPLKFIKFGPCDLLFRLAIVLSSGLVFFGSGVRCMFVLFPGLSEPVFTGLCHFGAILNGIPGIVVTSIPPAISATWFPPEVKLD